MWADKNTLVSISCLGSIWGLTWIGGWFLRLVGVPISCICHHIDAARRVAVALTLHAFPALAQRHAWLRRRFVRELFFVLPVSPWLDDIMLPVSPGRARWNYPASTRIFRINNLISVGDRGHSTRGCMTSASGRPVSHSRPRPC